MARPRAIDVGDRIIHARRGARPSIEQPTLLPDPDVRRTGWSRRPAARGTVLGQCDQRLLSRGRKMDAMPIVNLRDGQAKATGCRRTLRIDVHPVRRRERSMKPDAMIQARQIDGANRSGPQDVRRETAEVEEPVRQVCER